LVSEVNNQRIEMRTIFDGEDLRNCVFVKRIGTKAVDRFRRESDKITFAESVCGNAEGTGIIPVKDCRHKNSGKSKGKSQKAKIREGSSIVPHFCLLPFAL
jgi:hypothetical protein